MSRLSAVLSVVLVAPLAISCGRSPVDFLIDEREFEEDEVFGGCEKVDFLFVIDNSASMGDNQRKLVESFDVFVEGVEQTQASLESIHVGVATTDAYVGNEGSCRDLGGLVTRTVGFNSSESECGPYAEGRNYMTEMDDLEESFVCAAQVGTTGNTTELPLEALTSAVGDLSEPGECNEGFIRDDALLVAVIVTDEDDPGPVAHRYERVVEAKGGHEDNVVVVGLINEPGTDCSLAGHAREAFQLSSFIGMFTHSFVAPVCGDYRVAFERAISVVQAACWDRS